MGDRPRGGGSGPYLDRTGHPVMFLSPEYLSVSLITVLLVVLMVWGHLDE